jgi:hypothetical protein
LQQGFDVSGILGGAVDEKEMPRFRQLKWGILYKGRIETFIYRISVSVKSSLAGLQNVGPIKVSEAS